MRVRFIVGLDALVLETFLQYDFMKTPKKHIISLPSLFGEGLGVWLF